MGSPTSRRWVSHLYLREGRALYLGPALDTSPHAHHAVQISIALEGSIRLRVGSIEESFSGAVLIPPDMEHAIAVSTDAVAMLYLDPELSTARAMKPLWTRKSHLAWQQEEISPLGSRLLLAARQGITEETVQSLVDEILDVLTPSLSRPSPMDPRIRMAIDLLGHESRSLDALAKQVGLSPGRMGHLFRQEVGLPLRPYRLWLRLQWAMRSLSNGADLTTSAHAAGFSDSAHLSRTFRRMFGISPSSLRKALFAKDS